MCASLRMPTISRRSACRRAAPTSILGGDLVVTGSARSLAAVDPERTRVYVNAHETLPGDFTRDADFTLPARRLLQAITFRAGADRSRAIDATRAATALIGDSIGANIFLLGLAWQAGSIPLSREAIERAIELNGVDIELNKTAFTWGRRAAVEPDVVTSLAERAAGRGSQVPARDLDEVIARRVAFLTDYQSPAYAARYRNRVESVRVAETKVAPGQIALTEAVARSLFKLMAVKDEYEVARLYSDGSFDRQLPHRVSELEADRRPSRPAAFCQARPRHRPSPQSDLRSLRIQALPRIGPVPPHPRHAYRSFPLDRRSADGAPAARRL